MTKDVKKKERKYMEGATQEFLTKFTGSSHIRNDKTKGGGIYTSKTML